MDSRSPVSRGGHRTHKVRRGQKHEKHHSNDIDNHGKEAQAPFDAAAPDRLNERGHERKHDQRGTSGGHGRKSKSRYQRSEEHTSELQSLAYLVCRLLLEKKKKIIKQVVMCQIYSQTY